MATDATRRASTDGVWVSGTRLAEDRNPYLNRDTMLAQPIAAPQYTSAYAFLSAATMTAYTLTTPGSTNGLYGAEACGAFTSGTHNGWDCAAADWPPCSNVDGYSCIGTVAGNNAADITVKIGQPYQLRDVDCYDSSVTVAREEGIGWGTLSGQAECH